MTTTDMFHERCREGRGAWAAGNGMEVSNTPRVRDGGGRGGTVYSVRWYKASLLWCASIPYARGQHDLS